MAEISKMPSGNCDCFGLDTRRGESGAPTEGQPRRPSRNLVVCIDGTSNQFGPNNTNVIELYSQIIKSDNQLTYYNSGIGTYAKPSWKSWSYLKQVVGNTIDLAIAWNFEKIVLAAYRWLSENYQENDRIYLFGEKYYVKAQNLPSKVLILPGFSRGAYQVRALAGMIEKVGLIHKGNEDQIPLFVSAYELYVDQKSNEYYPPQRKTLLQYLHLRPQPAKPEPTRLANRFKTTFSRENVNVHFIGVWDTVSSIGIVRGKNLPLTEDVKVACFFRHALALDERRVKFLPEFFGGISAESLVTEPLKAHATENTDAPSNDNTDARPNENIEAPPSENIDVPPNENIEAPANKDIAPNSEDIDAPHNENTDTPHNENIGLSPIKNPSLPRMQVKDQRDLQKVKEVWFPGTHSDVGGGNEDNMDLNLGRTASIWMSFEAISCGLELKPHKGDWDWDTLGDVRESLTSVWHIFEWFPLKRSSYKDGTSTTRRPHRGHGRKIRDGHKIHASVAFCKKEYNPGGILPASFGRKWEDLVNKGQSMDLYWAEKWKGILEMDMFDFEEAKDIVQNLSSKPDQRKVLLRRLMWMSISLEGSTALINAGAIPRLEKLVNPKSVKEIILGDEAHSGLNALGNLAAVYSKQGHFEEAQSLLEAIIGAYERILGRDNLDTIATMRKLANTFEDSGRYKESVERHQDILQLREEILKRDHPDTMTTLCDLANALRRHGKYEEAEDLEREVLFLRKKIFGARHPDTIMAMSNLADTVCQRGIYEEAEKLQREVLSLRKEVLGARHPDTLTAMANLAVTVRARGVYEEAEKLQREVLSLRNEILGTRHPNTLMAMANLAATIRWRGIYEEAEKLEREVLSLYKEVLGARHPHTIMAMSSLAVTVYRRGTYEEAEKLQREVLTLRREILGMRHPDTLMAMANLANTVRARGIYGEAEKLQREVLSLREEVLGARHPDTITAMSNIASTFYWRGTYKEAEKLHREVFSLYKEVLGARHPNTITAMSNLANTLRMRGMIEEAKELEREVRSLHNDTQVQET